MSAQPLDRVIWEALSTQQRDLAEGGALARRYPADVAPFAATLDDSSASYRDLLGLLGPSDRVALFTTAEIVQPQGMSVVLRDLLDQMVFEGPAPPLPSLPLVSLQAADVPAMLALTEATRPGPFARRTIEMGAYVGIKMAGALVAMTGERMKLDGFTEVSGVCVDPSQRGLGLAAALVGAVTHSILAYGEVPFLHVFASNNAALTLYRKLGFVCRRQLHLAVLTRASDPVVTVGSPSFDAATER